MTKSTHVMLDLETLSSKGNAAIVAIGAVAFDGETGEIIDRFYHKIDPQSCEDKGLHISASTFIWWMQQPDAARAEFKEGNLPNLWVILNLFHHWIIKQKPVGLWGNGSDFDNKILENAYRACEMTVPWDFRINRCFRTIRAINMDVDVSDIEQKVRHHALHDAEWQTQVLLRIMNGI